MSFTVALLLSLPKTITFVFCCRYLNQLILTTTVSSALLFVQRAWHLVVLVSSPLTRILTCKSVDAFLNIASETRLNKNRGKSNVDEFPLNPVLIIIDLYRIPLMKTTSTAKNISIERGLRVSFIVQREQNCIDIPVFVCVFELMDYFTGNEIYREKLIYNKEI